MACLNPSDLFLDFNITKLTRLAKFHPSNFSETDVLALDNQLWTYIVDIRSNDEFLELKGIGDLARKMMETNKDVIYLLVYFSCEVSFDPFYCDCNSRKKFFSNEIYQE